MSDHGLTQAQRQKHRERARSRERILIVLMALSSLLSSCSLHFQFEVGNSGSPTSHSTRHIAQPTPASNARAHH
jgi:hypothetical protein